MITGLSRNGTRVEGIGDGENGKVEIEENTAKSNGLTGILVTGSGHLVFTSTKTVVTSGVLPDSDPFTPLAVGHYECQVTYTGLENHITLTDECGNEPLEVRSGEGQPPVGGQLYAPNKLVLLKPYLTLLGLLAAIATAVAITRGRRP